MSRDNRKGRRWSRHECGKRVGQWAPRRRFLFSLLWLDRVLSVGYVPYRGFYPRELAVAGTFPVEVLASWSLPEWTMKKKVVGAAASQSASHHLAAIESDVLAKFPCLLAHCAVTRYEDGDPRRPGWWTVKTQGAAWVCQVKDPDACAQLQCIAQTLDDALTLAELLLSSDEAPWEPDPFLKRLGANSKK